MPQQICYGYAKAIEGDFNITVDQVKSLLKDEGFGILCEIDIATAMKEKIGAEFRPYLILGACNPQLAHSALTAESQLGLLLPCNVVVQAENGKIVVSAVNAAKMLGVVDNAQLHEVAKEANTRLRRVIDAVGLATS